MPGDPREGTRDIMSSHNHQSVVKVLLAFAGGVVLGGILSRSIYSWSGQARPEGSPPSSERSEIDYGDLQSDIRKLRSDLAGIVESIDRRIESFIDSQIVAVGMERKGVQPAQGMQEGQGDSEEGRTEIDSLPSFSWLEVLPSAVGKTLVVRGLSPYDDRRIAVLLTSACESLSLAESQNRDARRILNSEYSAGVVIGQQFALAQEQLEAGIRLKTSEILSNLSSGLDAFLIEESGTVR